MNAHRIFQVLTALAIVLTLTAPASFTARAEAPTNDNFADAATISTTPFSDFVDIADATIEEGEPNPSCSLDKFSPSHTVWYVYTASDSGNAQGTTDGWYATFLAVYRRTEQTSFMEVGCWRYVEYFSFDVEAGETYYLQMGSTWDAGGFIRITMEFNVPPPNDNFSVASIVSGLPYNADQDTRGATIESSEPSPTCLDYSLTPGHTVWYAYTASQTGAIKGSLSSDYGIFATIHPGADLSDLTEIGCRASWESGFDFYFSVQSGTTYYIRIGSTMSHAGHITFSMDFIPPPGNDDFMNAMQVGLDDPKMVENIGASLESSEPIPTCVEQMYRTVWFRHDPSNEEFITASNYNFIAAYTGDDLSNLTLLGCSPDWRPLLIKVEAGKPYYFQVGSSSLSFYGTFTFQLTESPMPTANFGWSPEDPSVFDSIEFCDYSEDPAYTGFSEFSWDFGDGTSSFENCAYHQYTADGNYTVFYNITTTDGRRDPDGETKTISVRTHEVAITKITAPLSANARQSRTITVEVKNTRYPETVRVVLYKCLGYCEGNEQVVGAQTQYVPVRSGNRTSRFVFNYTFSPEDAAAGKVSFKAVAELQDYREANPIDNEAVSTPPTKVSGRIAVASEEAPIPQ